MHAAVLAGALLAPLAAALDPATRFRDYELQQYGIAQGLPQISVLSVAQDAHGYLWVGTQGGVARFDGLRFVTFDRAHTGIDTTMAMSIAVDGRDRVWFGTPRGAVVVEDGEVRELRAPDALLTVRAIALDAEGEPLFATERGVLRAVDGELRPALFEGIAVNALLRDDGGLWAGGDGALLRLVGEVVTRHPLPVAGARVNELARAGREILVGTDRGAFRFDPDAGAFSGPLAGDAAVESMLVDRRGNLWLGSTSALTRLAPDGRREDIAEDVLDGRPWVDALFEDRDGNLWIGTRRESLYRARDSALRMRSLGDGLDDPMVWSVLADRDGVLVGSNSSLSRLGADGRFIPLETRGGLPQATVYELARDGDGALWIGTRRGVARLAAGKVEVPAALAPLGDKQVTGFLQTARDDRWFATLAGLYRWRGGALETVIGAEGVAASRIRALLARGPDEMWVGTEDGVRVVKGGAVTRPDWAAPFDGVFVTRLAGLPDGRVLIGTMDSGLGVQSGDALVVLRKADGLPSENAWALDLVDDMVYVGSLDGIWRLPLGALPMPGGPRPDRVAAEIVAGSGYRDSSVRGFACCNGGAMARSALSGGFLYYPSTEGVVRLDPNAARSPPASPPAVVEGVHHRGELRHGARPFRVDGDDRDLAIEYTGVAFVRGFALQFRYRLEGYDADWVEAEERRTAYYTHLPHGEFRFVVQARTPNGEWGAASQPFEIEVAPLWHELIWVRGLALLLVFGLGAMAWTARVNQLRARQAELERAVNERTRELARANERLRVANQNLAVENQTDPLTGLYNRRFVLSQALRGGAARTSDRSAVLLVEPDGFKRINDEHGLASGDRVLVELGDLLSRCVRGGDVVARWDGVQFVLILPGLDESGALELAERVRARVAEHRFRSEHDDALSLTASIGFAHHLPDPASGEGIEQALDLADAALHRARDRGRNRVAGIRRLDEDLPARMDLEAVAALLVAGRLVWVEARG